MPTLRCGGLHQTTPSEGGSGFIIWRVRSSILSGVLQERYSL